MSSKKVRAGEAFVVLGARDQITNTLNSIAKRFKSWGANISQIGGIIAGSASVALSPIMASVAAFTSMGDSINKASIRTRIAADELAALRFAAQQSGVQVSALEQGIFRMDRRVGNFAATGGGPAAKALQFLKNESKTLSISFEELANATPEKKLEILMTALNGVENEAVRNQLGFELFGNSFRQMQPLLAGGTENLKALKQQAKDAGLAFTGINADEQAANAAAFGDAMNLLKQQFFAIVAAVGGAVVPALTSFFSRLTPIISAVISWANENQGLIQRVAAVLGVILLAGSALLGFGGILSLIGFAISGVSALFGVMIGLFGAILSPVGLVIAAIVAGGAAFLYFSGTGGEAVTFLKQQFQSLLAFLSQVVGGMSDAFAAGDLQLAAEIGWLGIKIAFQNGVKIILNIWDGMLVAMRNLWTNIIAAIAQVLVNIASRLVSFVNTILAGIDGALQKINSLLGTEYSIKFRVDFDGSAINKIIRDDAKRTNDARNKQLEEKALERQQQIAALEKQLEEKTNQAAKARADAELAQAEKIAQAQAPEFDGGRNAATVSGLTSQGAVGVAALGINVGGEQSIAGQLGHLIQTSQDGNDINQSILEELQNG